MQEQMETPVRLGFFQKRQLKQAAEQHFNDEMLAVVTTGYSDLGGIGTRSTREMKSIQRILGRHRLLFSCISLLALSDEAIRLYNHAFSLGIPVRDAMSIVGQYREDVRGIGAELNRVNWSRKALRIAGAYRRAMLDIAAVAAQ